MRLVTITIVMFISWVLLSGHFEAWLLISGAACAFAVALVGLRMGYADEEGHPLGLVLRGLIYWPWLLKEIVVSALDVTAIIINPKLPISPVMIKIKASQKTAVGFTSYANSITLTPGTISALVSSRDHEIVVHAISRDSAMGLADGKMDRRVSWFEGRAS